MMWCPALVDVSGLRWMSGEDLGDAFAAARESDDPVARRIRAGVRAELLGREDVSVHIDRFVVLERIGAGAMGVVYAAYDPKLDRRVALKLLWASDEEAQTQAMTEARALARLSDPHVVTVHEVGEFEGRPYVAMEWVQGRSLHEALEQDHLDTNSILSLFIGAGRGLSAAHAAGVVHRDFKPANVVVGEDGRVRVADFGLAVRLEGDHAQPRQRAGTPLYMAPEQRRGDPLTPAVDQYAFCVALWEALAGRHPDAEADGGQPNWPAGVPVSTALHRALVRGLAVDPSDRWPTMDTLIEVLATEGSGRRSPSSRALALLGAVAVAGLGAAVWTTRDGSESPCQGAQAQMDQVWGAPRRAQVEAAFSNSGVAFAAATWELIAPRLDRYASDWVDMHTDACEATAIRREQSADALDLRMGCLARARLDFDSSLAVLAETDETVAERAVAVVDALPPLARCADLEALARTAPLPDPDEADAVEELRDALAPARALHAAGKSEPAGAALEQLADRFATLRYEPALIELELLRGKVLRDDGDTEGAQQRLTRSLQLALKWGHPREAAQAATELVFVAGTLDDDIGLAVVYADIGRALVQRSWSPQREAELRHHLAAALVFRGRNAEAHEEEQRALALLRDVEPSQRSQRLLGGVHQGLGNALSGMGRYEEARREHERAKEAWLVALGTDHPNVATAQMGLSAALAQVEAYDDAVEHARQAVALLERGLGDRHYRVGRARSMLGGVLGVARRWEDAEPELRAALSILTEAHGDDHPTVAACHHNLALALQEQGRIAESEVHVRKALAISEKIRGPQHPDVARTRTNLGELLRDQGRDAEAEIELRAALNIAAESLPDEHPLVSGGRVNLAFVLMSLDGHDEEARELLEQAWAAHQRLPEHNTERAQTAFALARVVWTDAPGGAAERTRARELARSARVAYAAAGQERATHLARIDAWLAERNR